MFFWTTGAQGLWKEKVSKNFFFIIFVRIRSTHHVPYSGLNSTLVSSANDLPLLRQSTNFQEDSMVQPTWEVSKKEIVEMEFFLKK